MFGSAHQGRDSIEKIVEEEELAGLENYKHILYDQDGEEKLNIYSIGPGTESEEWIESTEYVTFDKDLEGQIGEITTP